MIENRLSAPATPRCSVALTLVMRRTGCSISIIAEKKAMNSPAVS